MRKAERAWLLSKGEESEALIRVAFDSLGQKQRVFEPYRLSLSSMVAASISQNPCPEHSNQLSRKWRCLRCHEKYSLIVGRFVRVIRINRSKSQPLILKGKIHSAIDGETGRAVSFDHLVFFIKNVIQAAENLEVRGKIEGYGGVKEGITGQSQPGGRPS